MLLSRLRHSQQLAGALLMFVHTSPFRPGPRFNQSITILLQRPTADTGALVNTAVDGRHKIYQSGFELAKAGVMLLACAPPVRSSRPSCCLRTPHQTQ